MPLDTDWVTFTESLTTFELRVAITALTALLLAIVVYGLIPAVIDILRNVTISRLENTIITDQVDNLPEEIPRLVSPSPVIRLSQILSVIATVVFLAYIWDQYHLVTTVWAYLNLALPTIGRTIITVLLLLFAYISAAWMNQWIHGAGEDYNRVDKHQIEIITRSTQIIFLFGVALTILAVWEIEIGNILLGAGVITVVAGLAVRETLSSILAGFLLMFSRPIEIGDWIEIANQTGTVMEITILNTRLRNADGERIIIPNDKVASQTIINRSRRNRIRLRSRIGVSYGADVAEACEVARDSINDIDRVLDAPSPEVIPSEFSDSQITLEARYWIENPNSQKRDRTHAAVVEHVKSAFNEEDITIPFPQRTLGWREDYGSERPVEQAGQRPVESTDTGDDGND